MYTEEIHIGLTVKTSKVIDTIEFEEDDLIREGMGHKLFNGELDLHRRNYYIGEWLVDLWGRDEDEFDCEFEDDEYVTCIATAEGRARAEEMVVSELESLLEKLDR